MKKPICIGHISTDYLPHRGGVETYISNLMKVLSHGEFRHTVYQSDTGIKSPEICPVPRLPGLLGKYRGISIWTYNPLLLTRRRRIKQEDILIVHYPFHYPPVSWHKRAIVLSHMVAWEQPPKRLTHKIRKRIAMKSFARAPAFVANDTNFFREMGVEINSGEKKFEQVLPGKWFIPNCVDVDFFCPADSAGEVKEEYVALKERHPIVVARNISFVKGIHLSIEAYSRFVKEFPETTLVIAGNITPGAYSEKIKRMCESLGLRDKVKFLGHVPFEKMPDLFRACEMSLVPSLRLEATALSALEAMACGVATITTNIGGLADLPSEKCNPDVDALLKTMLQTYEKRDKVGKKQMENVRDNFNLQKWADAWREVINYVQS